MGNKKIDKNLVDALGDDVLSGEELTSSWDSISKLLGDRATASKNAYENDKTDEKVKLFLKHSMEFYAFSRLIHLFGKLIERTVQETRDSVENKPVDTTTLN